MSISIQQCGHSVETTSRAYVSNPTICPHCAYVAKHGEPASPYKGRGAISYRAKQAKRMKEWWAKRKASNGPKQEESHEV